MNVLKSLLGRIIYTDERFLFWKESIDNTYNGYFHKWSFIDDIDSRKEEAYNFFGVSLMHNNIVFQTKDQKGVVLYSLVDDNITQIDANGLTLTFFNYKGWPKFVDANTEQEYYLNITDLKLEQIINKVSPFKYWNNQWGISSYSNCIYCFDIKRDITSWMLDIASLTYDRGGHHYAALTPKNDVPHQCLFHNQLLLALFCTHTAAIDLQTGRVVWEHNIGSEHRYWYHESRLVLMQGAYIYELCPDTGTVLRENVPFTQATQLPLLGRKTNMVGNHERIYFCLAEPKEIVTLDAATLQIVAIDKIEHNKEAVLLPPEKIYLSGNKLFITLQCQQPTVHNEILVYEA
jgi:hypothetical protein